VTARARAFALAAGVALVVLAAATTGCTRRSADRVLVIQRTMSYHRDTCARVNMARTQAMTVAEARAAGYRPCPLCEPEP
jgi:hypothetical protein